MALDEIFTYIGIGGVVHDINNGVLDSAKPSHAWKTSLGYDSKKRVIRVSSPDGKRLDLKYGPKGDLIGIGDLPYDLDWRTFLRPLGKCVVYSSKTLDFFSKGRVPPLKEREFDWQFTNYGVAVFAFDCNKRGIMQQEDQLLKIGTNLIICDQYRFVIDVNGLKVEYETARDPNNRYPFPSAVGGISLKGNMLVCLGLVKDTDLKKGC